MIRENAIARFCADGAARWWGLLVRSRAVGLSAPKVVCRRSTPERCEDMVGGSGVG